MPQAAHKRRAAGQSCRAVADWRDAIEDQYLDLAEPIVMDYNIDPERSDQLLAVKFGLDGKITGVDWES